MKHCTKYETVAKIRDKPVARLRNNGRVPVAYPGILFGGGIQQIQLRAEDRENGDLEAVAPQSGVLEAAVISYRKFHFI
jgi:hypothetical protein